MASKKGPQWERDFAVQLSLWWTNGESDQEFWRTAGSGARATTRGKKGLKTKAHNGDILAVDEVGKPLTDYFSIELKRGYSKNSIQDLLDAPIKKPITQEYEKWIEQAKRSAENAGSVTWMIVVRRDRREPLVMMDYKIIRSVDHPCHCIIIDLNRYDEKIILMKLSEWFELFTPQKIKDRVCLNH